MTPLPGSRVVITGLPASGKTSVAVTLARREGLPHIEVDRLYYGPAFVPRPTFAAELTAAIAQDTWCLDDFGLPESRDQIWERADTVVWLDLPYGVAARRAIRRTWRRLRSNHEVLPGCRESWIGWGNPRHPVFLAVTGHGRARRDMSRRLADPRWAHLNVVRLRSTEEIEAFLGPEPHHRAA